MIRPLAMPLAPEASSRQEEDAPDLKSEGESEAREAASDDAPEGEAQAPSPQAHPPHGCSHQRGRAGARPTRVRDHASEEDKPRLPTQPTLGRRRKAARRRGRPWSPPPIPKPPRGSRVVMPRTVSRRSGVAAGDAAAVAGPRRATRRRGALGMGPGRLRRGGWTPSGARGKSVTAMGTAASLASGAAPNAWRPWPWQAQRAVRGRRRRGRGRRDRRRRQGRRGRGGLRQGEAGSQAAQTLPAQEVRHW